MRRCGCTAALPWGPKSTHAALLCIQKMLLNTEWFAFWAPRGPPMRSKGPSQALRHPISSENTKSSVLHMGKPTFLGSHTLHFAPLFTTLWSKISSRTAFVTTSSASGVNWCPRQNPSRGCTRSTIPVRGSFDATKLVKHLSISVDRCCSTAGEGSL